MENDNEETSYKYVQGLSRGLAVLKALSYSERGRAQLADISSTTGLHRTTVRRLLETLKAEGYVERSDEDGAFELTLAIKKLTDGFGAYDQIADSAIAILRDLSAEVTWPCALATPDEDCMIIRHTTHHVSPLSFHRKVLGRRLPMLMTSMGRAYLAFSPTATREHTLELIGAKYESGEVPLMSLSTFRQILLKTQRDGYGSNYGEWSADKKVAAIAVPIRGQNGHVIACVNVVAVTRAVQPQQLEARFLGPLKTAAAAIEKSL